MASAKPRAPSRTGSHAVLAGVVLYLVAWFVPVFQGQDIFGSADGLVRALATSSSSGSNSPLGGPDWLPGWQASRIAWNLLIDDRLQGSESWRTKVVGSTCLTNVAMVFAILMLLARHRSPGMGAILVACAGLNASWIYLADKDPFTAYRAGYYIWTLSFALVGVGMLAAPGGRMSTEPHSL